MDAVETLLLFDHYGELLTERQKMCLDLKYNQDMSLAEIAEELGVSRQAEAHLQKMEEKTGCVRRYLQSRKAKQVILSSAEKLRNHPDPAVRAEAEAMLIAAGAIEE